MRSRSRRSTWRLALPALTCGLLTACAGTEPEGQLLEQARGGVDPSQLNVLLLTVDTLRADRVSAYGSRVSTPNLDRLAAEGVLFTSASTTVPFTLPAHTSIMTGLYPPSHGVRENVGYTVSDEHTMLAQRLRDLGRDTAGFVSAFVLDARWGIARGFDHYFDDFDLGGEQSPNLGAVQRPGSETIAAFDEWLDERSSSTSPFFAWVHLYDPHDPYTPPEPYRSQYPGAPYDAEVAYTDALVGELLDGIAERGLAGNTVIVMTSDHGEGLGEHGESFHGLLIYDSTVRVPLIVRFPGGALSGLQVTEAVSHVDLLPTILRLVEADVPEGLHGEPLTTPIMRALKESDPIERAVYAESFYPLSHYGWSALRSLRSAAHKYIEAPSPELFDLVDDPGESSSLYSDEDPTSRQLARALRSLTEEIEGEQASSDADLDERTLAHLRALGYVAGRGATEVAGYDPSVPRADPKERVHVHRMIMVAQSLVSQEKDSEAERLLERALTEEPRLLDGHYLLGNLALHGGDPVRAEGHFRAALEIDDLHQPSVFGLANAQLSQGREDDALVGFRRALQLAGSDSKATLAIADLQVSRGEQSEARAVLEEAAVDGAPAIVFNRLGEVQALQGDSGDALDSFRAAVAANERFAEPHFNLAVLNEQSGELTAAQREYETAIDKAPQHFRAQFNLSRLLARRGEARAIELLEQSIESNPEFALGYFLLGKERMDGGLLDEAEELTRRGLEITEENALGWFVLADILNRQGKRREANGALARASALRDASDR
ncbi:MAG: sulfatase-like hydrolase/transferase [Acidobacteriota bacterium]